MPATLTNAVLVYDGECEFCKACVRFLVRRTRRPLDCVAYQTADLSALGLTRAQCVESVQWVSISGGVASAHVAVACALRYARWPWPLAGRFILLPGVRHTAAMVYRATNVRSPNSARWVNSRYR
jgi:predicted DCC family thiol-disulfide oxidoreductase YuxK